MGAPAERAHGTCPRCSSGRTGPYRSHAEGDWAVSCVACGFEAGRAPDEEAAWQAWDAVAGLPLPDDTEGGLVPGRDDAPEVERLAFAVYTDRCGDHDVEFSERPDGGFVRFEDHERALALERGRSDSLQGLLAAVREELAVAREAAARPVPLRTYWQCAWSSHRRHDRESGRQVISTSGTIEGLYEDMAAKRIAHLHDEDSISQVFPGDKPSDGVVFSYGPVRLMAVGDERAFDVAAMEASDAWIGFHARQEEHRVRLAGDRAARQAEAAARAEERDRAEYERLQMKFGTGETA